MTSLNKQQKSLMDHGLCYRLCFFTCVSKYSGDEDKGSGL